VESVDVLVCVGGQLGPVSPGGWDAWPLASIAIAIWLGRRLLDIPWGAPLLIAGGASGLILPLVINAWGVVPAAAVTLTTGVVLRLVRPLRPRRRPGGV